MTEILKTLYKFYDHEDELISEKVIKTQPLLLNLLGKSNLIITWNLC